MKEQRYDWTKHVKAAKRELEKCGISTKHVTCSLPDNNGEMKEYGPMTFEEAVKKCKEYWNTK